MPCNADENVKNIFHKTRQLVTEALEQGNMSNDPANKLTLFFLDLLSPDEKALFHETLTKLENGELEI